MLSETPIECPPQLLKGGGDAIPVAVVNAASPIVIESAYRAFRHGLAHPLFIGPPEELKDLVAQWDWHRSDYEIVPSGSEEESARIAVNLARDGAAGALMKGQIHTDVFMSAIVDRKRGLRTEKRLSHVFHMTIPGSNRALLVTDAAVNIAPDLETKKAIISNAIELAHLLGHDHPKVALVSATEEQTPRLPSSMDAAALSEWALGEIDNALVHGPLAFDNAVSPKAAAIKGITHPVAGNADIVVVPNIEAGNILFKDMVYCSSACAAGVVLGAQVPIILTSRADPPASRLASLAITSIMSAPPTAMVN